MPFQWVVRGAHFLNYLTPVHKIVFRMYLFLDSGVRIGI